VHKSLEEHEADIILTMKSFVNYFQSIVIGLGALVSVISLIIVIKESVKQSQKQLSKEITSLLRKQIVYLIALNIFDLVHTFVTLESFLYPGLHLKESMIFALRTLILPIIKVLIEPKLLIQLKSTFVKKE
jgi:hypothetical protein